MVWDGVGCLCASSVEKDSINHLRSWCSETSGRTLLNRPFNLTGILTQSISNLLRAHPPPPSGRTQEKEERKRKYRK